MNPFKIDTEKKELFEFLLSEQKAQNPQFKPLVAVMLAVDVGGMGKGFS